MSAFGKSRFIFAQETAGEDFDLMTAIVNRSRLESGFDFQNQSTVVKNMGIWESVQNERKRASLMTEGLNLLTGAMLRPDLTIADFAADVALLNEKIARIPTSLASARFAQSVGTGLTDPLETFIPTVAGSFQTFFEVQLKTAALGGLVGSAAGPLGTAVGIAAGIGSGTGLIAGSSDFFDSLRETMAIRGLDPFNPTDVETILSDQAFIQAARRDAIKSGVAIGVFDGLFALLGGKFASVAVIGAAKRVGRQVAGVAIDATGGGLGEVAAQLAKKGEIDDAQAIVSEVVASVGPGALQVAAISAIPGRPKLTPEELQLAETEFDEAQGRVQLTPKEHEGIIGMEVETVEQERVRLEREGQVEVAGPPGGIPLTEKELNQIEPNQIQDVIQYIRAAIETGFDPETNEAIDPDQATLVLAQLEAHQIRMETGPVTEAVIEPQAEAQALAAQLTIGEVTEIAGERVEVPTAPAEVAPEAEPTPAPIPAAPPPTETTPIKEGVTVEVQEEPSSPVEKATIFSKTPIPAGDVRSGQEPPSPILVSAQTAVDVLKDVLRGEGRVDEIVKANPDLQKNMQENLRREHGDTITVFRSLAIPEGKEPLEESGVVSASLNIAGANIVAQSTPGLLMSEKGSMVRETVIVKYEVPVESVVADVGALAQAAGKTINTKTVETRDGEKIEVQDILGTAKSEQELRVDLKGVRSAGQFGTKTSAERFVLGELIRNPDTDLDTLITEGKKQGLFFGNVTGDEIVPSVESQRQEAKELLVRVSSFIKKPDLQKLTKAEAPTEVTDRRFLERIADNARERRKATSNILPRNPRIKGGRPGAVINLPALAADYIIESSATILQEIIDIGIDTVAGLRQFVDDWVNEDSAEFDMLDSERAVLRSRILQMVRAGLNNDATINRDGFQQAAADLETTVLERESEIQNLAAVQKAIQSFASKRDRDAARAGAQAGTVATRERVQAQARESAAKREAKHREEINQMRVKAREKGVAEQQARRDMRKLIQNLALPEDLTKSLLTKLEKVTPKNFDKVAQEVENILADRRTKRVQAKLRVAIKKTDLRFFHDDIKAQIEPIVKELDASKLSGKKRSQLASLAEWLADGPDESNPTDFRRELLLSPRQLRELGRLDKTPVSELTEDQAQDILDAILHLQKLNRDFQKALKTGRQMTDQQHSETVATEIETTGTQNPVDETGRIIDPTTGGTVIAAAKRITMSRPAVHKPDGMAEFLGGLGSLTHELFYKALAKAQNATLTMFRNAVESAKSAYQAAGVDDVQLSRWSRYYASEYNALRQTVRRWRGKGRQAQVTETQTQPIELSNGSIDISKSELMTMWAMLQDPDIFNDIINRGLAFALPGWPLDRTQTLTIEDAALIVETLRADKQASAVVEHHMAHMNTAQKAAMREWSLRTRGYDITLDHTRFPKFRRRDRPVTIDEAVNADNFRQHQVIENAGMTKTRMRNDAIYVVRDFFEVFHEQAWISSNIVNMSEAVATGRRVAKNPVTRAALLNTHGIAYIRYLENLFDALAEDALLARHSSGLTNDFVGKAKNAVVMGVLGLNPQVALYQVVSMIGFGLINSPASVLSAISRGAMFSRKTYERMMAHSQYAWFRGLGSPRGIVNDMTQSLVVKRKGKLRQAVMFPIWGLIRMMDGAALSVGWLAAEIQVEVEARQRARAGLAPLSAESTTDLVVDIFDAGLKKSQPTFDPLHSAGLAIENRNNVTAQAFTTTFRSQLNSYMDMFYTFSTRLIRDPSPRNIAVQLPKMAMILTALPLAILAIKHSMAMLRGAERDEEDEVTINSLAATAVDAMTQNVLFGKFLSGPIRAGLTGDQPFRFEFSPVFGIMADINREANRLATDINQGEADLESIINALEDAGTLFGIPRTPTAWTRQILKNYSQEK